MPTAGRETGSGGNDGQRDTMHNTLCCTITMESAVSVMYLKLVCMWSIVVLY